MTNKHPQAIWLAEYMEYSMGCGPIERESATLLRTQHALLERARDEMKSALPFMELLHESYANTLAALNQHLDQP